MWMEVCFSPILVLHVLPCLPSQIHVFSQEWHRCGLQNVIFHFDLHVHCTCKRSSGADVEMSSIICILPRCFALHHNKGGSLLLVVKPNRIVCYLLCPILGSNRNHLCCFDQNQLQSFRNMLSPFDNKHTTINRIMLYIRWCYDIKFPSLSAVLFLP